MGNKGEKRTTRHGRELSALGLTRVDVVVFSEMCKVPDKVAVQQLMDIGMQVGTPIMTLGKMISQETNGGQVSRQAAAKNVFERFI